VVPWTAMASPMAKALNRYFMVNPIQIDFLDLNVYHDDVVMQWDTLDLDQLTNSSPCCCFAADTNDDDGDDDDVNSRSALYSKSSSSRQTSPRRSQNTASLKH
jgi:hypothetical protein